MIDLQFRRLPHGEGLPLPAYATAGAAGLDIVAAEPIDLAPGARHAVATGFAIAIPDGYEVQVRPRSGWALRTGVTLLNSPGTVDADYRGEVSALLINLGDAHVAIARGARIAQLVIQRVEPVVFEHVESLTSTQRGESGHGSSGGFDTGRAPQREGK